MHRTEPAAAANFGHFLVDGSDAVAALRRRLSVVRVLGEHHVWEALRVLPSLDGFREDAAAFVKFRALMDCNALDKAIMLLAASAAPARALIENKQAAGIWSCSFALDGGKGAQRRRICTAHHPDRSAALLGALVASDSAPE